MRGSNQAQLNKTPVECIRTKQLVTTPEPLSRLLSTCNIKPGARPVSGNTTGFSLQLYQRPELIFQFDRAQVFGAIATCNVLKAQGANLV